MSEDIKAENERLREVLREIARPAFVSYVYDPEWNGGFYEHLYNGWREIAVERIDMARDALGDE